MRLQQAQAQHIFKRHQPVPPLAQHAKYRAIGERANLGLNGSVSFPKDPLDLGQSLQIGIGQSARKADADQLVKGSGLAPMHSDAAGKSGRKHALGLTALAHGFGELGGQQGLGPLDTAGQFSVCKQHLCMLARGRDLGPWLGVSVILRRACARFALGAERGIDPRPPNAIK